MGLGEVASGEWRVTSLKKKQILRCAQDDRLGKGTKRKRGDEGRVPARSGSPIGEQERRQGHRHGHRRCRQRRLDRHD